MFGKVDGINLRIMKNVYKNQCFAELGIKHSKNDKEENFPVSSFLISKKYKRHIKNLYFFARSADDIADSKSFSLIKKYDLLNEFDFLIKNKKYSKYFFINNLLETLEITQINKQYPLLLLEAFKQDVEKKRYESWEDLINYCNKSASPVGRFVVDLHYFDKAKKCEDIDKIYLGCDNLCNSLQIINHIQDCKKDFLDLNRIYLPQEYFRKFNSLSENLLDINERKKILDILSICLKKVDVLLNESRKNITLIKKSFGLKKETYVIYNIAKKLSFLLKKNDPIKKNVKLSHIDLIFCFFKGIIGRL